MKAGYLAVSRQGELAVINHKQFQIQFNLSKGTWNYSDGTGYTIIRNGYTHITLSDGASITTKDAGTCEFMTGVGASSLETDKRKHQVRFSHEAKGKGIRLNIYVSCYPDEPHIELKVGVENLKEAPIKLQRLTLLGISSNAGSLQLGGNPSDYYIFTNMPPTVPGGFQKLYEGFQLSDGETAAPCHNGILHDTDSHRAFVFGFLTTEKWWPHIQAGYPAAERDASGVNPWSLYHQCEGEACRQGEEITSESIYLNFSMDAASGYQHYTELLALQNKAQKTEQIIGGWSLARPAREISEGSTSTAADKLHLNAASIIEQTGLLAKNPLFRPNSRGGINYIHLDAVAGRRTLDGSWGLNAADFPNGMKHVVDNIRDNGFKASIRINPFCEPLESELLQKRPHLFLQKPGPSSRKSSRGSHAKRGRSRKGAAPLFFTRGLTSNQKESAVLDVSHPEAQAYIRKQIKQIINEWKYELIHVDFSAYTTALSSARHLNWYESSLTSLQLYRLAIQLVKDEVRESSVSDKEVLLAGYNLIAAPSIGSFSLNSPIVSGAAALTAVNGSHFWHQQQGTKHRISRYAVHLQEHKTLWNHIFGELIVGEPRPINEAILEMTAAALSGGAVFCKDNLTTLKPHRAELLAKIFPLTGEAATPIELYEEPFPRIWHLKIQAHPGKGNKTEPQMTNNLVAIFNWSDKEDDVYFQLSALGLSASRDYLVHDFWMRQYLGSVSDSVTLLNVPPRSAKLLSLREAEDKPQLLATDMHYTQGSVEILSAGWDAQSENYLLVCKPPRQAESTCFIHVPDDYLPIGVSAYGCDYQYSWDKPICRITFGITETLVHASIQFSKTSGGNL